MEFISSLLLDFHPELLSVSSDLLEGVEQVGVLEYIKKHYARYQKLPEVETIRRFHPNFILMHPAEPSEFYLGELRNRLKRKLIQETLFGSVDLFKNTSLPEQDRLERIQSLMQEKMTKLNLSTAELHDYEYLETTEQRWNAYESRQTGITGIPTGIPTLDRATKGYQPGELVCYAGFQGVGKTWLMIYQAYTAWKAGHRVLFVTKEMSALQIMRRLDAIQFQLPYKEFYAGRLSPALELKYRKGLNELRESKDLDRFILTEETRGSAASTDSMATIASKVVQYKPAIVFIDGAYLLNMQGQAESYWVQITNLTRGLKTFALNAHIPVVFSHQLNRDKGSKTDPTESNISYSYSPGQDSDMLFAMYQPNEAKEGQYMKLKSLKIRESSPLYAELNWDMELMDFSEIPPKVKNDDDGPDLLGKMK